MQKFISEMLSTANKSHHTFSEMLPGADVSPSIDQALYSALEGLEGLRKACTAHLVARKIQDLLQADGALLAESVIINEVEFRVDPAQKTLFEEEAE